MAFLSLCTWSRERERREDRKLKAVKPTELGLHSSHAFNLNYIPKSQIQPQWGGKFSTQAFGGGVPMGPPEHL